MHRPGLEGVGAEPGGQFGDVLAAGVVKVLARGKDLDCLRTGAAGLLKQAWVKALIHVEVRRQDSQLGQDLPRAGLMRITNRALLPFSHFGDGLCAG